MRSRRLSAAAAAFICILSITSGCSRISEDLPEETFSETGSLSANTEAENKIIDDNIYIYSQLSADEQDYYDIFKEAVDNFAPAVKFPDKLEPEVMRKILIAVYNQEESQFWLNSLFFRPKEVTDILRLEYRYTEEQTITMQKEIDEATDRIFSQFDETTTDYEKLLAFHDYLVLNCTFSRDTEFANTIYGGLVDGYAQCEGYAFSFDYLCRLAGIDCFVVSGTNLEGELHAWDMVKLDGKWYHVDCTWDDPILDPPDTEYLRHYYFLVRDCDIIGATHIEDNSYFSAPICTDPNGYFSREGLTADSADEGIRLLKKAAYDALVDGHKDAAVRFSSEDTYMKACDKLFTGKEIRQVFEYANTSGAEKRVKTGKYVRYLNDTEFIVHVSMIYDE